jgi:signal transduction histidine kinase
VLQKATSEDLVIKAVSLRQILGEAKEACLVQADERVSIEMNCPDGLVLANELLKEVFTNILSNAVKHTPGTVSINIIGTRQFEADGAFYRVAIEDNGPGISDDIKSRVFSRYARGQTKARGSGLGLYLVRALVERYHGKVWVEDKVPGDSGKGARFVVLLPAAS